MTPKGIDLTGEFYDVDVAAFATFEEAVTANQSSARFKQSVTDSEYLAHAVLLGGAWSDSEAVFHLSGPNSLHLFVANSEVQWALIDDTEFDAIARRLGCDEGQIKVRIRSRHAGQDQIAEFSRMTLLAKYVGKRVSRLTIDQTAAFLQFSGTAWQLAFSAIRIDPDQRPLMLWWDETD